MAFPPPTERQARILWTTLTTLAVGALVTLGFFLLWTAGWVVERLSSVIWPLAVAAVIAYLLDPMVDWIEQRLRIPRTRAILLVFMVALALVLSVLAAVVPKAIVETKQLTERIPGYAEKLRTVTSEWLEKSPLGARAREAWETQYGQAAQTWVARRIPEATRFLVDRVGLVVSWFGLVLGLALVPVYLFYFLLEKRGIQSTWTDYLPVQNSPLKQEVVFILTSINDCLIVFFRGQMLVAICDGVLLTLGFLVIGLDYAVLLGMLAGLLSIVPYLGVMISLIPALLLALIQIGGFWGPAMVLVLFGLVQMLEGLFIAPKIIGDRVGLHPLTIIVSVMVGTSLLGGLLGGILAIPLTAALRALMFRYVWRDPKAISQPR